MFELISKIIPELIILGILLGINGFEESSLGISLTNFVIFSVWIYLNMAFVRVQNNVSPVGLLIVLSIPFLLVYYLLLSVTTIDSGEYTAYVLLIALVTQLVISSRRVIITHRNEVGESYLIHEKVAGISLLILLPGVVFLPAIFELFDIPRNLSFIVIFVILIVVDIIFWSKLYTIKNKIRA